MVDYAGKRLGKYALTRLLGSGGYADVYLGKDLSSQMPVAIKVLTRLSHDEAMYEKFRAEAKTMMKLVHKNIIHVYKFENIQHIPIIVMHYASGGSALQRYPHGTRVPLQKVIDFVNQMASALQYAHDRKIIHRDVKPANMLFEKDTLLLSDFGIAAAAHSTFSQVKQDQVGTSHYMAPEQFEGEPRPASDQYALAIVTYEWLTGKVPFDGTAAEIMHQHFSIAPLPLHRRDPAIPREVGAVVLKALAKDPKDRFGSVRAFAKALEQAYHAHDWMDESQEDFSHPSFSARQNFGISLRSASPLPPRRNPSRIRYRSASPLPPRRDDGRSDFIPGVRNRSLPTSYSILRSRPRAFSKDAEPAAAHQIRIDDIESPDWHMDNQADQLVPSYRPIQKSKPSLWETGGRCFPLITLCVIAFLLSIFFWNPLWPVLLVIFGSIVMVSLIAIGVIVIGLLTK